MITACVMGLLLICVNENDDKSPTIQTQYLTKWEYKQVAVDAEIESEKLQSKLELLGEQGWELTSIITRRSATGADTLLFKRRKESKDVDIAFLPEMGLIKISGDKSAVKQLVNVIEETKKKSIPSK